MPPPALPVNQGSRAALITWTVITSILFVVATVFAIYYYVEKNRVEEQRVLTENKFKEVVAEAALNSPEIAALREARTAPDAAQYGITPSMTVVEVLQQQVRNLASLIGGTTSEAAAARQAATAAIQSAAQRAKAAGAQLSEGASLVDAVGSLSTNLAARQQEVENLQQQLKSAQAAVEQKQKETETQLQAMQKTIEGIRAEQSKAMAEVSTVGSGKDEQIRALQQQMEAAANSAQEAQAQFQVQISDLSKKLQAAEQRVATMQERLNAFRVDVNKPVLRQSDGYITRLPGGDVVFINLGQGQQIAPGMTFEVYDKIEGIPAVTSTDENVSLPQGKASIEVVRVGATGSEARIIRRTPGAVLTQGDLIANLVYDPNTKYQFFVYGSFDLDNDGRTTPEEGRRDAEVIKRLITQWGGGLSNEVNVDTDFVVLGKEPVVPNFTREELEDPINRAKQDAALAEAQAYDEVKSKAAELRIPVLNQNRFLYLCGYYEMAAR